MESSYYMAHLEDENVDSLSVTIEMIEYELKQTEYDSYSESLYDEMMDTISIARSYTIDEMVYRKLCRLIKYELKEFMGSNL